MLCRQTSCFWRALGPVNTNKNVATITIGGNDAGFADVLQACALHACLASNFKLIDGQPMSVWLPQKIDSLHDALFTTLKQLREGVGGDASAAFVLGYPHAFPASSAEQNCLKLTPWRGEMDFLNQRADQLNGLIASAAASAGIQFVPVQQLFAGHEVCGNSGEWINGPEFAGLHIGVGRGSFQPNTPGQEAYAQILADYIDAQVSGGAPTLPTGFPTNPPDPPTATSTTAFGTLGELFADPVTDSPGPCTSGSYVYSPGQQLQLSAYEFAPSSQVEIGFAVGDTDLTPLTTATADSSGAVSTVVTIPLSAPLNSSGQLQVTGLDIDAGNRAVLQVFDIEPASSSCDATPPSITITTPPDGTVYTLGQPVTASYSCDDGPAGSGVASCVGPVPNGGALDTASLGAHTFTVTAVDNDGNQAKLTHAYSVTYGFSGFLPPVSGPPTINVANAGQTVPIKWTLTDATNAPVVDQTAVTSVTSVSTSCVSGAPQDSMTSRRSSPEGPSPATSALP